MVKTIEFNFKTFRIFLAILLCSFFISSKALSEASVIEKPSSSNSNNYTKFYKEAYKDSSKLILDVLEILDGNIRGSTYQNK